MNRMMRIAKPGLLVVCFTVLAGAQGPQGQGGFPTFEMEELHFEARPFDEALFERLQEPELDDIPGVSSRYDGRTELARFPVERILIEGVVPYPDQGITQETIQALIDDELITQQAVSADENGFTQRDLLDMGAHIRDVYDRGSAVDAADMQVLIDMVQKNDIQRGWITVEQLDEIALKITETYREAGFILATAFVPEQEVRDGVIRINVLEGRMGDVQVANNVIYEDNVISAIFTEEIGQAVTEERVESALRRINDLPGVRVRGSFSPGDNVGETRLNLNVLEERAWTSSVILDNHGSATTGEGRIFANTEWINLWDRGHRLAVGLLRSEGPDSTTYGLVNYTMPFTKDGKGTLKGSISSNEFVVGATPELPEITGETDNVSLTGSYQFIRARTRSLSAEASYTFKDALFEVEGIGTLSTDQKIESFAVFTNYTQLWDDQLLLLTGRLGIDQGHIMEGGLRDQSTNFTKLAFNANVLKRFDIYNWLTKDRSFFNFVFKTATQYTEKQLPTVEKFSLGGPNGVRAFSVSDVSVDSGATAGFELYFDMLIDPALGNNNWPLEPLKPFLFFDYGYGTARSLTGGSDRDAVIKGYGLGMRIVWPGRAVANLIFASPHSASYEDDFLQAQGESRVFIDLNWTIR